MPTADDPYRLPRTVLPRRYDLHLDLDLDAGTAGGRVTIAVDVVEPVGRVTLNLLGPVVTAAAATGAAGPVAVTAVVVDEERERVHLDLADPLPTGAAELVLDFDGRLDDGLVGLYRSTFSTEGVERTVAVTQFESTHARRAFPCFDEPDMKAVVAITLDVADDLLAVSNAAEVDRKDLGDGRVRVRYADTIAMSTYLIALVVGPLEATPVRAVEGIEGPIPLRIVHPPGNAHLTAFALDVADAGIRFLERYYGLPYPGDKVDLVAVPDFAFGAMENLGCITFREVLLLVDPDQATQQELQRVADVINHELAHMWFGDLVTMGWWNGIWLNEAFATFMEVTASDAFRPEWDTWTSFGLARAQAFDTDALTTTRPIEFPVHSPADAEAMFDVLTYEKGAAVVRMLEQYLGPERFRSGIGDYLRRHALGNTETTDLWDALEESTGEPVRRIMDGWILRGGHPVVDVPPTDTGVRLDQRPARSVADGGAGADGRPGGHGGTDGATCDRWPVPLVVTTRAGSAVREHRVLLDDPVELDTGGPVDAVRANTAGNGFFRTALPASLAVADATDPDATPLERFVTVDDAWAALLRADVGAAEVAGLLRLAAWREADPSVWRRIAGAVRDLRRLAGPSGSTAVATLAQDVAAGPLARVEQVLDEIAGPDAARWQDLRGILVGLLGTTGEDGATRAVAREVFLAGDEAVADAALRAASLDVVAATAGADEHRLIEDRWHTAATPQDRLRHLYALADTTDPDRFAHTLSLALTEVRPQDAAFVLRRALTNDELGPRAWTHLVEHWDDVVDLLPSSALPRMLEGVRSVTDAGVAADVADFLGSHPLPSGEQVVAQHVERMWVTVAAAARVRSGPGVG